jgi:hypothetical protein
MDEQVEKKIGYLHMAIGLLAGIASGLSGKNGLLFGLLIGYVGFFLSKALFSLDREEFTPNIWLSKGAVSFLMVWLPVWIFVYNL